MIDKVLFVTKVGSHIWGMDTIYSDIDLFEAYMAPTVDILKGTAKTNSKFTQTDNIDIVQHEIGKIINQLLKGNINFLIGVMSPIIEKDSLELYQLRRIVQETISKNCYPSIHGMGQHNFKKYILSKRDISETRCNKILRMLLFGQRILKGEGFIFDKVEQGTPKDIEKELVNLDIASEHSRLSNRPIGEPFRDWLYALRVERE